MRFVLRFVFVIALAAVIHPAFAQRIDAAAATGRRVITWVPPYAISQSYTRLQAMYGTSGPRKAITHLALQFWVPSATGRLTRAARYGTITNAQIQQFVTWGHANGIKVLLCVYNGEYSWDWPLARKGFKDNRTRFIGDLIAEMEARGLDGIDVDLEGVGDFQSDKASYMGFIAALSQQIRQRSKILTVDTFHYIYNAPNQLWWSNLFPYVDGINSMGYEDLGRNAPTWQSYAAQKARAGNNAAKLQIGIPSYLNSWQGNFLIEQLYWFRTAQAGQVGVAIWDAQFTATGWSVGQPWNYLRLIHTN